MRNVALAAVAAFCIGLFIEVDERIIVSAGTIGATVGVSTAAAQPARRSVRRTARRTSRRTSARMNYYNSLPAGCARRGAYYYCDGIYYQTVVQGGRTVYIVVNP